MFTYFPVMMNNRFAFTLTSYYYDTKVGRRFKTIKKNSTNQAFSSVNPVIFPTFVPINTYNHGTEKTIRISDFARQRTNRSPICARYRHPVQLDRHFSHFLIQRFPWGFRLRRDHAGSRPVGTNDTKRETTLSAFHRCLRRR